MVIKPAQSGVFLAEMNSPAVCVPTNGAFLACKMQKTKKNKKNAQKFVCVEYSPYFCSSIQNGSA